MLPNQNAKLCTEMITKIFASIVTSGANKPITWENGTRNIFLGGTLKMWIDHMFNLMLHCSKMPSALQTDQNLWCKVLTLRPLEKAPYNGVLDSVQYYWALPHVFFQVLTQFMLPPSLPHTKFPALMSFLFLSINTTAE